MAVRITTLSSLFLDGGDWEGEARRRVIRPAEAIQFGKEALSRIELIVTEMATNLIQHRAHSPTLRFGITRDIGETGTSRPSGLLIISEDRGPGIANPERVLQDHYSTAGTMGGGLGAIRRLSDGFSITSDVARSGLSRPGTVVISRLWLSPPSAEDRFDCEILTQPMPGEKENGDGASFCRTGDQYQVAVIDGLGHGAEAFKSTEQIQEVLRTGLSLSLTGLLEKGHAAMHKGRGAVVGILRLNRKEERARYAGIGNIDCRIYGKHPARPVSMNGSVGVVFPRCREEAYPFGPDDFFVMASDGLSTRWDAEIYPQFPRIPFVARAALLLRDFGRTTDDVTVAVGGFKEGEKRAVKSVGGETKPAGGDSGQDPGDARLS